MEENDGEILSKCVIKVCDFLHMLYNFVCENCSCGLGVGIGI
jgi:hypothetical protein